MLDGVAYTKKPFSSDALGVSFIGHCEGRKKVFGTLAINYVRQGRLTTPASCGLILCDLSTLFTNGAFCIKNDSFDSPYWLRSNKK